jgi:hypothetical protein
MTAVMLYKQGFLQEKLNLQLSFETQSFTIIIFFTIQFEEIVANVNKGPVIIYRGGWVNNLTQP